MVSLADVEIEELMPSIGHEEFHLQEADTVDYLFTSLQGPQSMCSFHNLKFNEEAKLKG